jgi:hypothetical protein
MRGVPVCGSGESRPHEADIRGGGGQCGGRVEAGRMCEEEAVRYLRDLCGEKEALERAQEKQLIATKLVAQGRQYNAKKSLKSVKKLSVSFFSRIALGVAHPSFHYICLFDWFNSSVQCWNF